MRKNSSRAARMRTERHPRPTGPTTDDGGSVVGSAAPGPIRASAPRTAVASVTPVAPAIGSTGVRPPRRRSGGQSGGRDGVSFLQSAARVALGSVLVVAGTGHLSFARQEFQAQVPRTLGLDPDAVVVASGWVEIALGGTVLARGGRRPGMGWFTAAFFAGVFPGNLGQFVGRRDGFGLDTDNKRALRLLGQPVLIAWALWSMGAVGKRRG